MSSQLTPKPTPDPKTRQSASRGAFILMGGTLGSRVTGLLRNALFVQLFAPSVTDALNVALKVPNLFRELLAEGALTNSFVPVYKGLAGEEAKKLSGALLSLLFLINTLLVLLAVWGAPWVVSLLLQEDANVDYALTVTLTRVVFPFLAAISFSALAMGILQAEERFFAPAWAPVALNVVTATLMLLYPGQAVPLAVAFVLGGAAQLLVQLPALLKHDLLPQLGRWWHPALGGVLVLMIPFTFTTGARQFLNVVATNVLSGLPRGSVTAFENANLFLGLALGLFSISPALAYYSRLSANASQEPERFSETLLEGLRLITFLTVPAGLLLCFLAAPAVQSVLNWLSAFRPGGGMNPQVVQLSVTALAPLGLAVFPIGLRNLLIRTFYVRREVMTPIAVSVVFISLNALLYTLLAPRYGIAGLSWSTALVEWAQLAVLVFYVWRREGFSLANFLDHALRVWLSALGAAGLTLLALEQLPAPSDWSDYLLRAVLGVSVLGGFYVLFSLHLGLPEMAQVAKRLRR